VLRHRSPPHAGRPGLLRASPIGSLVLAGRQESKIDAPQTHFFLFANSRDNNGDYRRRLFIPTLEEGTDPVGI
jgi:hypothetical protein